MSTSNTFITTFGLTFQNSHTTNDNTQISTIQLYDVFEGHFIYEVEIDQHLWETVKQLIDGPKHVIINGTLHPKPIIQDFLGLATDGSFVLHALSITVLPSTPHIPEICRNMPSLIIGDVTLASGPSEGDLHIQLDMEGEASFTANTVQSPEYQSIEENSEPDITEDLESLQQPVEAETSTRKRKPSNDTTPTSSQKKAKGKGKEIPSSSTNTLFDYYFKKN
ncbi:MAG: hypothetical protein EXX96DRAFT_112612 [Benjaminiella poitrasii]|nr:MAG: hypothetical protein EXX96DRAFT_112612 [Benjaminiella poitrasii]